MSKLKELYARKQQVIAQMRDNAPKDGDAWTEERKTAFNKADSDLKALDEQISAEQRLMEIEKTGIEKNGTSQTGEKTFMDASTQKRSAIFAKAQKIGASSLSEEERSILNTVERDNEVYEKWFRSGGDLNRLNQEERTIISKRAQSVGTTTAGGYTVPEGFSGEIDKQLQTISSLLNWARVYRTASGNDIPWPTNNDTSNTGELLGENSDASSSSADLVFGLVTLKAYKFSSKMIKSSSELIQDNGVNLPMYIAEQLAERVGKVANTYFTTGTGSSQPLGYMDGSAGAQQGKVSASATAFTAQELIDLMHSVDAQYRLSPSCAWAFHDLILAEIKKLAVSSSDDRPLWLPSIREGEPDTLYGKPYFVNNAMASTMTTGSKIMAFGDWSKFVIRIVNDFSLKFLTERYAEFDQVAWVGFARMDSKILNRTAIKYLELT